MRVGGSQLRSGCFDHKVSPSRSRGINCSRELDGCFCSDGRGSFCCAGVGQSLQVQSFAKAIKDPGLEFEFGGCQDDTF